MFVRKKKRCVGVCVCVFLERVTVAVTYIY